ncbi:MAG: hypothetical protein JW910_12820, partial [Anaerolineae bacterium]|nr:hypothetical protein [Anaerolineae bacterium]
MSNVQRIQLGQESVPLEQGRSTHGRWRCAFQHAEPPIDDGEPLRAALVVVQDAARLAFALATGPAAAVVSERLADYLWTRETAHEDWPQNVRDWLNDPTRWADAPPGTTNLICGRLERQIAGGRLYLAWLGSSGIRLLDRAQ